MHTNKNTNTYIEMDGRTGFKLGKKKKTKFTKIYKEQNIVVGHHRKRTEETRQVEADT